MSNQHNPHEVDTHHRLSGSPGVRVRQSSGTGNHTRVSGVPSVGAVRTVPIATLASVRDLLTHDSDVRPAAEVLRDVHELLSEWL